MTPFLEQTVARKDGFERTRFLRLLARQGVGQQSNRFYIAARPSLVRNENRGRSILLEFDGRSELVGLDINRWRRSAWREKVAARCGASRHLKIDEGMARR